MESCSKHPHELGVAVCGRCGDCRCADCIVHVHGDRTPPLCLECAMFAGGVRSSAPRPALSKRQMRRRLAEVAAADAARHEGAHEPVRVSAPVEPPHDPTVTDWSNPWWEERPPTAGHEPPRLLP